MQDNSLKWQDYTVSVEEQEIQAAQENRCVIFMRSGRTVKINDMSASHVYRIIMESDDMFVLLDGVPVNVAAIDTIEDISRINRKEPTT